MDKSQPNPLTKYFRAPGLSVKLPSGGLYQPINNVEFAPSGDDVSVLPMRGADEMLMKSPDALMSGHAIEETIKSCVPGILDARLLPTCDVDALLLAIRAATYGDQMDIECKCPACQEDNSYAFSISYVLDTAIPLKEEYPVRLSDDVVAYIGPFNLITSTQISIGAFQEARKMHLLEESKASEEEQQAALRISFDKINKINTRALASSVMCVVVPDGPIDNPEHIAEFVDNISREWLSKIEAALEEVNKCGIQKSQTVSCAKCEKEFTTTIEFDPANFFGKSS
jgi:phage FluMu protein Com